MADYPKPSLTADAVVLAGQGEDMRLLVIERARPPYAGSLALPGGFVDPYELPLRACLRELDEETGLGLSIADALPLSFRAREGRDPRGWTISQPYLFHLKEPRAVSGGDDARRAFWQPLKDLDAGLAFDHGAIVNEALGRFWPWMPGFFPALKGLRAYAQPESVPDAITFYGGSFNPWHQGHRACLGLCPRDGMLVLVPDANPFKATSTATCAWQHFQALREHARAAGASIFPGFCGWETPNPTVRWLPYVQSARKALLMGADSFVDFPRWYQAERLAGAIDVLYVAPRLADAEGHVEASAWFTQHVPRLTILHLEDHPYRHLSSTALRQTQNNSSEQGASS